jgi:hypothetical protein
MPQGVVDDIGSDAPAAESHPYQVATEGLLIKRGLERRLVYGVLPDEELPQQIGFVTHGGSNRLAIAWAQNPEELWLERGSAFIGPLPLPLPSRRRE